MVKHTLNILRYSHRKILKICLIIFYTNLQYIKVIALDPSRTNPGQREKVFIKPFEAPQRSVKIKK